MSFGIQNLGVINQKNAPAIWISPVAQFPTNNIKGRMLLALDTITFYVDLVDGTGGMTNRAVIANGLINNGNGTTIDNIGFTGDYAVDLGGDMVQNTTILLQSFVLEFVGNDDVFHINPSGAIVSDFGKYYPIEKTGFIPVTPNTTLLLKDIETGENYYVAAEQI